MGLEAAQKYARKNHLEVLDDSVRVFVQTETRGTSPNQMEIKAREVETQIENIGGFVETSDETFIQSRQPLSTLHNLAGLPSVRFIRPPIKPHLDVVSQGVAQTGADAWQSAVCPKRLFLGAKKQFLLENCFG